MSTRSCIMLKVRKEDFGKKEKFDTNLTKVVEWDCCGKKEDEVSEDVELNTKYIGVYCHSDGYPSWNGRVLKENYNTYDKAKSLILGGDISFIDTDNIRHYANRGCEEWKYIKPTQADTQKGVYSHIDCEYIYLFDEERGGWVYKSAFNEKGGFKAY